MRITRQPSWAKRSVADGNASACSRLRTVRGFTCASLSVVQPVRSARGLQGNKAVAHFLCKLGAVAPFRIAVAAAAAGLLVVHGAARHARDQVLVFWGDRAPIRIGEADGIEAAIAAFEQTEGRLEVSVAERHQLGVIGPDLEDRLHAKSAPPFA